MKILIPVLNFGKAGGYRVLSKIADELINLGHSVDFMSSELSMEPYYPTLASIKWIDKNGEVVKNNKRVFTSKDTAISIQVKLTRGLKKIPKDHYDIIIANHSLTTFPIIRAGLKHKTLYYVQAYEPELYKLSGGIKNTALAYLSKFSYKMKLFTVVNAALYLNYKKLKASRILYPGIDSDLFYPKTNSLPDNAKSEIIIGTIGRFEPYKGTRYIIEAFNNLKQKYPEIKLHVAFGDPKDFVSCEGVYCFQPHGDEELGNFYRTLDYYFCAGYTQMGGFHYPIAEAMSCGIPVITTRYFPSNEDNSWLIAPQKIVDIVRQFELAQSNPELREKKIQQALKDVQQFNWQLVGEQLNKYLNEFLDNSINKN